MSKFSVAKTELISKGVYKNAINTDHTDERIYITIPYGSIKNSGVTKVYKRTHKLNIERIVKFWFNSIDKNKKLNY